MTSPGSYHHVQVGWVHWILLTIAAWCVVAGAFLAEDLVATIVPFAIAPIFMLTAACFHHLTVRDDTDALRVAFGPWELAKKRVPYHEIRSVEKARSTLIDGWGIHYGGKKNGWIWNLSGFDCLRLELADGKVLRIGTDDPDGLADFLRQRAGVA